MLYTRKMTMVFTTALAAATLGGCDSRNELGLGERAPANTSNEAKNLTDSGLALPESGGRPNDDLLTNQGRALIQIDEIKSDTTRTRDLQSALKAKGFDPGPIDGLWGPLTQDAFNEFKDANGIQGDSLNAQAINALELDQRSLRRPASAR